LREDVGIEVIEYKPTEGYPEVFEIVKYLVELAAEGPGVVKSIGAVPHKTAAK
jgi:hypothetical protein